MYQPSANILKNYADILIKFALRSGEWCKPWDVVLLQVQEVARPILEHLYVAVLEAGGHPIVQYIPDGLDKIFYQYANLEQITYAPTNRMLGTIQDVTHTVRVYGDHIKNELAWVESSKMMSRLQAMQFYKKAMFAKEWVGKLTWTLALYGTPAMAAEVEMTIEEYRDQIIKACYLDYDDPISQRKQLNTQLEQVRWWLSDLPIEKLHVVWEDADLWIQVGADRQWLAGSGRNIPSFECFVSPNWRWTNGWIRFNQALYYQSNIIKGIQLWFEDGKVVKASATENEQLLLDMIAVDDADKVGEYSLTDRRMSRITRLMGDTLYDENIWWVYGNTHLALWSAYKDSYIHGEIGVSEEQWKKLGFNDSAVHTDIMSTTDRTVTATLSDGSEMVIYKDGEFQIELR